MFVIKKNDIIKKDIIIRAEGDCGEVVESEVIVHFRRPTIKTGRWYRKHTKEFFKLVSDEESSDEDIYQSTDGAIEVLKEHIVDWEGFVTGESSNAKDKPSELEYSSENFDQLIDIPPVITALNAAFSDLIMLKVVNEADKAKNSESSAKDGQLAA